MDVYPHRAFSASFHSVHPSRRLCTDVSDRCLMCPVGQFLGGRTGFELDGQRGSVHVVSASRHAEQHGIQPHRGLSGRRHRRRTNGLNWTHSSPSPVHPIPARLLPPLPHPTAPNNPPGCILTLWRQSWDFTTATHSNVHPEETDGCVIMAGAARSRLVTVAKTRRHEPDSTDKRTSEWDRNLNPVLAKCCALLWIENDDWWFFFNSIHAPHHIIDHLEGNSTAFLHLITRFPSWPKY